MRATQQRSNFGTQRHERAAGRRAAAPPPWLRQREWSSGAGNIRRSAWQDCQCGAARSSSSIDLTEYSSPEESVQRLRAPGGQMRGAATRRCWDIVEERQRSRWLVGPARSGHSLPGSCTERAMGARALIAHRLRIGRAWMIAVANQAESTLLTETDRNGRGLGEALRSKDVVEGPVTCLARCRSRYGSFDSLRSLLMTSTVSFPRGGRRNTPRTAEARPTNAAGRAGLRMLEAPAAV